MQRTDGLRCGGLSVGSQLVLRWRRREGVLRYIILLRCCGNRVGGRHRRV